jgi:hypothetical protein
MGKRTNRKVKRRGGATTVMGPANATNAPAGANATVMGPATATNATVMGPATATNATDLRLSTIEDRLDAIESKMTASSVAASGDTTQVGGGSKRGGERWGWSIDGKDLPSVIGGRRKRTGKKRGGTKLSLGEYIGGYHRGKKHTRRGRRRGGESIEFNMKPSTGITG